MPYNMPWDNQTAVASRLFLKKRRMFTGILILAFCVGCIWLGEHFTVQPDTAELSESRSFSQILQADQYIAANQVFSLKAGEMVEIAATYLPLDEPIDYGLLDADGRFYYFGVSNGHIRQAIYVTRDGTYRLAMHNRSKSLLKTVGFVYFKPECAPYTP